MVGVCYCCDAGVGGCCGVCVFVCVAGWACDGGGCGVGEDVFVVGVLDGVLVFFSWCEVGVGGGDGEWCVPEDDGVWLVAVVWFFVLGAVGADGGVELECCVCSWCGVGVCVLDDADVLFELGVVRVCANAE